MPRPLLAHSIFGLIKPLYQVEQVCPRLVQVLFENRCEVIGICRGMRPCSTIMSALTTTHAFACSRRCPNANRDAPSGSKIANSLSQQFDPHHPGGPMEKKKKRLSMVGWVIEVARLLDRMDHSGRMTCQVPDSVMTELCAASEADWLTTDVDRGFCLGDFSYRSVFAYQGEILSKLGVIS